MKLLPKTLSFALMLLALPMVGASSAIAAEQYHSQNQALVLEKQLEKATADEIYIAAPTHFAKAQKKYASALKKLNNGIATSASNNYANQGLVLLQQAEAVADKNQKLFQKTFAQRQKALAADAAALYPEQAAKLRNKLIRASELVEQGKEEQAMHLANKLVEQYKQLTEDSLKMSVTTKAREAIALAETAKAKKYAPKTFKEAEDQFNFIDEVVQSNHREMGVAKEYATKATNYAYRAKTIAEMAKEFELKDFSQEDMLRWHYAQLDKIAGSLGMAVNYQQPYHDTISAMMEQSANLRLALKKSSQEISKKQQEVSQVKQKYSQKLTNQQLSNMSRIEYEHRFELIKKLFKPAEATVYRDENDVLIKAHGFNFPVGKSNIEPENYAIVDKIITSVSEFPQFKKLIISGHTDSTGNASINKRLSKERADSVKALLVSLAKIPGAKIETYGYGDAQPVSNENMKQGRTINRRVEVRIVN